MAFCGFVEIEPIIEIDFSKAKKAKRKATLQNLYYRPEGYQQNAKLLREEARLKGFDFSFQDVGNWLRKQAIFQCYMPAPKYILCSDSG